MKIREILYANFDAWVPKKVVIVSPEGHGVEYSSDLIGQKLLFCY